MILKISYPNNDGYAYLSGEQITIKILPKGYSFMAGCYSSEDIFTDRIKEIDEENFELSGNIYEAIIGESDEDISARYVVFDSAFLMNDKGQTVENLIL